LQNFAAGPLEKVSEKLKSILVSSHNVRENSKHHRNAVHLNLLAYRIDLARFADLYGHVLNPASHIRICI